MDQEDPIEKRVAAAERNLARLYAEMHGILLELPIPISLPAEASSPTDIVAAVQRARELIGEEPAEGDLRLLLDALALDWLNAAELGAMIYVFGPAAWRIDAMEAAIGRASRLVRVAAIKLGAGPGGE